MSTAGTNWHGLIYDLGLHRGEDTGFYLKKGFRVVAVDANNELCRQAEAKFADCVASGQLVIVNRAIADQPGEVTFYENDLSEWGTINPEWDERNRRLGTKSVERRIVATTMADLIEEFGSPYFMKVDIEGMDLVALQGLRASAMRPKYVSIESDKVSFHNLRKEFELLQSLGYDRFKIVPQENISAQQLPKPAREGAFVEHAFTYGSSGAFGEEAPGEWLDAAAAIEAYKPIFLQYVLTGDDSLVRSAFLRKVLRRIGFAAQWHDTHARLSDQYQPN